MAKVLQLRRGTTAQNDAFTGAEGEVTVDTEKKTLRVHDGATAGGTVLAKKSEIPDITGKADKASLAPVATSGKYADLSGTPTIPDISGKADKASLAAVATTGAYNDLTGKPTLGALAAKDKVAYGTDITGTPIIPVVPTKVSAFENDAGYLTQHQSLDAYATKASLKAVATTGDYNDLTNRPIIPSVENLVPKSGDRGELRGYASKIGSSSYISDNTLTVNKDIPDFFGTLMGQFMKISVPDGDINTAWVKSVEIGSRIALTSITLGSQWKWENGLEPFGKDGNLNDYSSLVIFRWTGMSGIASFLSPYVRYLTEQQATNEYAKKTELPTVPTKVSAFENDSGYLTAHQDISGKVNVTGSRGALAGYETTGTDTTISATSKDSCVTGSNVTVSNGSANTSWTKIVSLTAEVTVTLGSSWKWQGGSAPTIVAGGILVCCWCGSFGLCVFVSPTAD